jgi:hypothetical protein
VTGRHAVDSEGRKRHRFTVGDLFFWGVLLCLASMLVFPDTAMRLFEDPRGADALLRQAQEAENDDDQFTQYNDPVDAFNEQSRHQSVQDGVPELELLEAEVIELTTGQLCVVIRDGRGQVHDWAGTESPWLCFVGSDGTYKSAKKVDIQQV